MNDHSPICESLAEAISLLAADCLTPDEQVEARRHLTICPACRERFEQLVSICTGLQDARPEESRSADGDGVARALAEIGATSTAKDRVRPLAGTDAGRQRFAWVVAMSLLVAAGYLLSSSVPPPPPGAEQVELNRVISPQQPTWLALQRAAAHSDEALDDLLARSSDAIRFSPLDTHSLLQETDL